MASMFGECPVLSEQLSVESLLDSFMTVSSQEAGPPQNHGGSGKLDAGWFKCAVPTKMNRGFDGAPG